MFFMEATGVILQTFAILLQSLSRERIRKVITFNTDIPIVELMQKHGFLNSKLFYDTFRNIYGCGPLDVWKRKEPR